MNTQFKQTKKIRNLFEKIKKVVEFKPEIAEIHVFKNDYDNLLNAAKPDHNNKKPKNLYYQGKEIIPF